MSQIPKLFLFIHMIIALILRHGQFVNSHQHLNQDIEFAVLRQKYTVTNIYLIKTKSA